MIELSIANSINITIMTESLSRSSVKFLETIYSNFPDKISDSKLNLVIRVSDQIPPKENLIPLGEDAKYCNGYIELAQGHVFQRTGDTIEVTIPQKVKRGRVPFKRQTPGRHITDEIIEPIAVHCLKGFGITAYHASSRVKEDGVAEVNVAWKSTGKTEAILPYIFKNTVLSDDLCLIDEENGKLYSYPRPLRLYSYNIDSLKVDKTKKLKLRIQSWFTPFWRPVAYIPIAPPFYSTTKYEKIYLNEILSHRTTSETKDTSKALELITDFEFAFFRETETMLRIAEII